MTATEDASGGPTAADDVARQMRAAAAADGHDDGPGAAGTADPEVVRTALATLSHDDQQLLWDLHVVGRQVEVVARERGVHVRSAQRRLRAAEQRLTSALSAAHTRGVPQRVCMETRGTLHEYVRHELGGQRRQALEDHLFGCSGCMRAFIDVRQASWALRDAAPVLLAGVAGSGVAVPFVVGAAGAAASSAPVPAWLAATGAAITAAWEWCVRGVRQVFGRPVAIAGGVGAAAVAVAAVAMVGTLGDGAPAGGAPAAVTAPDGADPADVVVTASPWPSVTPSPSPSAAPSASATPSPEPSPGPSAAASPAPSTPPQDAPAPAPAPEPTVRVEAAPRDPDPAATPEPETSTSPHAPSSPEPTAAPTAKPTPPAPEPTPAPTAGTEVERPEPAQVSTVLALEVGPLGVYRVDATAQITAVSADRGNVRVRQAWDGSWWVWTRGGSRGSVTVELSGPAGSDLGARLASWGRD
ncbi:zf-HC2 domain-containing protein [Isoptericola aurantiacus]|uniref:zf-HC2 domain-containing protein n=1 Tax=Isoptericola aurantiacus TaxID=3377839 RepID=UPI00383A814B